MNLSVSRGGMFVDVAVSDLKVPSMFADRDFEVLCPAHSFTVIPLSFSEIIPLSLSKRGACSTFQPKAEVYTVTHKGHAAN